MRTIQGLLLTVFLLFNSRVFARQVVPLENAHAHNDYEHPHPLFDALSQGFTSVEADVFLIKERLYVAHNRPLSIRNARSLEYLYLHPLDSLIKANRGQVIPGYNGPFFLMIDFKTSAEDTYAALLNTLQNYPTLLSTHEPPGPVTLFISGERPVAAILKKNDPLVALDGRPEDLQQGIPPGKMPVVSTSLTSLGLWNGRGEMPIELRLKIRRLSELAHQEGKKLRLWAIPDEPAHWQTLREDGVDLINTDRLETLKEFLLK